jgi:DNA polymerase Ligase (LigD)
LSDLDQTASGRRRFVILEHHWKGIHWDFMVEVAPGSPLRTWAIDAQPVAGSELPARELADHRREYLNYEGMISGGRGHVRRWDEGTCLVEVWASDRVTLILSGRQLTGSAEFWRAAGAPGSAGAGSAASAGGGSGPSWTFRLGKLS